MGVADADFREQGGVLANPFIGSFLVIQETSYLVLFLLVTLDIAKLFGHAGLESIFRIVKDQAHLAVVSILAPEYTSGKAQFLVIDLGLNLNNRARLKELAGGKANTAIDAIGQAFRRGSGGTQAAQGIRIIGWMPNKIDCISGIHKAPVGVSH